MTDRPKRGMAARIRLPQATIEDLESAFGEYAHWSKDGEFYEGKRIVIEPPTWADIKAHPLLEPPRPS